MNSSVKSRLLAPIVGLCLAWLSGGAAAADPPAQAASTATLLIDHVVHFQTAEGADLALDTGRYGVEPAAGGGLHLRATNGKSTVIPATAATHDEKLAEPRALMVPVGADEQHLVLLLPDGKRLEAIGSASGVRSRGLARPGVVSDVALQSALAIAPAVLVEPVTLVAPVAPVAALPAPPNTAYTGQLLAPPSIRVLPSCAERPAAGQPPAAELEPAYGRLSLSAHQGGAVLRPRPNGAQLGFAPVPGGVAVVVERAVAGTNAWTLVATTCANRGLFAGVPTIGSRQGWSLFNDISGGVVPRTTYDYRVTVIGAPGTGGGLSGRVWWNAIQWTAPDPIAPQWISATMTTAGALQVHWRLDSPGNPYMPSQPSGYTLSTPPGWVQTSRRHETCGGYAGCTEDFPNPPSGTHVFTLTALWQVPVNGVIQTVSATQSDMTVVIP